jgi:alkanesulfonate monooxygenase SsuD/methylene tetrahydromethanopterin reductase-like flavin-dependent oxidoreductase (luciferase family)
VTYRHPGLLIKTVTTLDVLSGGRAWLGIGAAWNDEEHRGLGVPYPSTKERFERLEETLQIAHQMWGGDDSPYEGTHYQLERPLNVPQPVRRPPILIGGGGEKKTLRLVAQYADACNIFDMGPAGVRAKYDVIEAHCADVGRDPAEIHRTVLSIFTPDTGHLPPPLKERAMSVDQAVEHFGALAAIGTDTVLVGMPNSNDDAAYEQVAEVVRQVDPIVPAGRG